VIERINEEFHHLPNTVQMDYVNLSMRIHRWQGRIASSTNQLWPCLSPFGLRSVLEPVLQTQTRLRLRSLLVRRMLVKYQPQLAEFPLDRGYPAAPLSWKNFYRFWPISRYYSSRIIGKINHLWNQKEQSVADSDSTLLSRLWQQEEVQSLLD